MCKEICTFLLSHPSRGAWIEIGMCSLNGAALVSHPSRGAWIEIPLAGVLSGITPVAPLAGCVD